MTICLGVGKILYIGCFLMVKTSLRITRKLDWRRDLFRAGRLLLNIRRVFGARRLLLGRGYVSGARSLLLGRV